MALPRLVHSWAAGVLLVASMFPRLPGAAEQASPGSGDPLQPTGAGARTVSTNLACAAEDNSFAAGVHLLQRASGRSAPARKDEAAHSLEVHRRDRKASTVPPLVHEVYTYGAPATHDQPMENGAQEDGCFPGLRVYTEDLLGVNKEIHQVDAAAMNNYFPHAFTASLCLHDHEDSYYTPCDKQHDGHPDWPKRTGQVYEEWRLHQEDDYRDRLDVVSIGGRQVSNEEPFASARKFVTLAWRAYDTVISARSAIQQWLPGWRLVERVVDVHDTDVDPVWLVQEEATLDCALVFTGTNDGSEFSTSTTQYGTGYCGFDKVHVGYRNELWTLTNNLWPHLRPKLEQCKRVICVGHSLGGALCEVFAACANSGHVNDPDYQLLAWTPGAPALIPEFTGL